MFKLDKEDFEALERIREKIMADEGAGPRHLEFVKYINQIHDFDHEALRDANKELLNDFEHYSMDWSAMYLVEMRMHLEKIEVPEDIRYQQHLNELMAWDRELVNAGGESRFVDKGKFPFTRETPEEYARRAVVRENEAIVNWKRDTLPEDARVSLAWYNEQDQSTREDYLGEENVKFLKERNVI
jgi:hypothetical protein